MADIVGIIASIENDSYDGKDFKKVKLKDGQVLKVKHGREGYLKAKWGQLQVDRAFSFTMGEFQNKPFVSDFTAVSEELEKKIKEEQPKTLPTGQETGMWWKELGEMLRAKDIDLTTPHGKGMRTAYYAQMLSVLPIELKGKEK